jgi:hypothetical protein
MRRLFKVRFLIDRTGSYEWPFLISAGLLGVGVLCSLAIDPTKKIREEPDRAIPLVLAVAAK